MLVGLLKTSLVNYPGRVCAAVFLPGCNLRCPFCHNADLATASVVSGPKPDADGSYVPLEEVYSHLEKRASVLGGLAISGGEPLLSAGLSTLILKARELHLAVKVDTNGTMPDRLAELLSNPALRPDMIAIDIKTSLHRYNELCIESTNTFASKALQETLSILANDKNEHRDLRVEYRTVLVPGLVGEAELRSIAALLPDNADWELASFVGGHCLDSAYNDLAPYGPAEKTRLLAIAKSLIPTAVLR